MTSRRLRSRQRMLQAQAQALPCTHARTHTLGRVSQDARGFCTLCHCQSASCRPRLHQLCHTHSASRPEHGAGGRSLVFVGPRPPEALCASFWGSSSPVFKDDVLSRLSIPVPVPVPARWTWRDGTGTVGSHRSTCKSSRKPRYPKKIGIASLTSSRDAIE